MVTAHPITPTFRGLSAESSNVKISGSRGQAAGRRREQLLIMMKIKGFTLIEILIALMVFAILATVTSVAMVHAFNTRDRITEASNRQNELQMALTLIQHASAQMVNRPIRAQEMRLFPAFVGQEHYMEFTQGGFINPQFQEQRSTLKRQAFVCQNNQLILRSWAALDPIDRNAYQDRVLLSNLEECHFAYINHALQRLNEWRANAVQVNQRLEPLPLAIQVNLTVPGFGKDELIYGVNGGIRVHQ